METAWLEWVNKTFGCQIEKFNALGDAEFVFNVLLNIDSNAFQHEAISRKHNTWVGRLNNLKRLYTLMNVYFECRICASDLAAMPEAPPG